MGFAGEALDGDGYGGVGFLEGVSGVAMGIEGGDGVLPAWLRCSVGRSVGCVLALWESVLHERASRDS